MLPLDALLLLLLMLLVLEPCMLLILLIGSTISAEVTVLVGFGEVKEGTGGGTVSLQVMKVADSSGQWTVSGKTDAMLLRAAFEFIVQY